MATEREFVARTSGAQQDRYPGQFSAGRGQQRLCRDVMTADPACCLPGDTVQRAAQLMERADVGPIPIVDDQRRKRLVGIITDRDLALKVVAEGRDPTRTTVDAVMTRDPLSCHPNDDLQRAEALMTAHQVRRIPVVDHDGRLVGIIAQADLATRTDAHMQTAKVVEEISRPGLPHQQWSAPTWPQQPHEMGGMRGAALARRSWDDGDAAWALLGGATLGAGLMYLLDPERGARRRSLLADQVNSFFNQVNDTISGTTRDLGNRTRGAVAETRAAVSREEVPDDVLVERVRAQLGRSVSHPRSIEVMASQGRVTLSGLVLAHELDQLLAAVASVRGVNNVENRLEVHQQAGNIPGLQR